MIEELRACPFCGGPAHYTDENSDYTRIECEYCGIRTVLANKEHVTRIWNQRVQG